MTWISDAILGRVLDLLDLGNPHKTGLGEILSYTFIPSCLAIIFLNYLTESNKWKLTILFTCISTIIDLGMQYSGYMIFHGWSMFYSIIVFLITYQFILPLHLRFIRREYR